MNFSQLAPIYSLNQFQIRTNNYSCSKCAVKYMSIDTFLKDGKQLRMCLACRNKKNKWYANTIRKPKNAKISQMSFRPQKPNQQFPMIQPEDFFLKLASNNDDDTHISFNDFYLEYQNAHPPIVSLPSVDGSESPRRMSILNLVE
jgi:hypothetical protein